MTAHAAGAPSAPKPVAPAVWAALASAGLLAVYFGALTAVSGWSFARDQFATFWPYVLALAAGFGIQVDLFTRLHRAMARAHGSGKVMAASGATSGLAMVSCCAHYLVNLVPVLGATGLVGVVGRYQVEIFWFGLLSSAAGIAYMARRLRQARTGGARASHAGAAGAYACPMHPDVRSERPGRCPRCGMALVRDDRR